MVEGCGSRTVQLRCVGFSCSYFFCQGGRHSTLLLAKKAWLELEESLNKLYEWRLGWTHAVGQVKLGGLNIAGAEICQAGSERREHPALTLDR